MKNFDVQLLESEMPKFNKIKDSIQEKLEGKLSLFNKEDNQEEMQCRKEGMLGIIMHTLNKKALYGLADITEEEIDSLIKEVIISNEGHTLSFKDQKRGMIKEYDLDEQGEISRYKSTAFRGQKQGDYIEILRGNDKDLIMLAVGYDNGKDVTMSRALPAPPLLTIDNPMVLGGETKEAIKNLLNTNDIKTFDSKMSKIQEKAFTAREEENKNGEDR